MRPDDQKQISMFLVAHDENISQSTHDHNSKNQRQAEPFVLDDLKEDVNWMKCEEFRVAVTVVFFLFSWFE